MASDVPMLEGKRLKGKVAIITGGARGLGAITVKTFARHGAYVVIADILDDLGTTLADSIQGRYIHCNVANEADVESAVNLALAWKGKLDIMFNNAGIADPIGSVTSIDMDEANHLFSINLNGVLHGIKHAARAMIRGQNGGSIICTSSTAAIMGGLGTHSYSASKGGIIGLVKSAACELGVHGIRVNCILPHGVASEMLVPGYRKLFKNDELKLDDVKKILSEKGNLLRGRIASAEDVALAALFLASEEAGFITAHNLVIDGGYTGANGNMTFIYQEDK